MQHSVEVTDEDYWAFTDYVGSRSGAPRNLSLTANVLIWTAFSYTAIHLIETGRSLDYGLGDWIAGPGMITLLFVVAQLVNWKYARVAYKPMPDRYSLGTKFFDISDKGLTVSGKRSVTTYEWSAIVCIHETNDHLFLLLDSNAALIVPRRSFAATGNYDGFRSRVEQFSAEPVPVDTEPDT